MARRRSRTPGARSRRRTQTRRPEQPWHIRQIIHAAARECPPGHAEVLSDLADLAMVKVYSRGIFDPTARGEEELFGEIDRIASRHLGLTAVRAQWQKTLKTQVLEPHARDAVEAAALQVQCVSDTIHFYVGLAFAMALRAHEP